MPFRNTYVVVEPMRPIAEDLAFALMDHDPAGEVLLAASETEAVELVADLPAVTLAIVHAAPRAHGSSLLGRLLSARGAVSVLIGDRAEEEGAAEFPVLQRPYATETILDLLLRLLAAPGVSTPGA